MSKRLPTPEELDQERHSAYYCETCGVAYQHFHECDQPGICECEMHEKRDE